MIKKKSQYQWHDIWFFYTHLLSCYVILNISRQKYFLFLYLWLMLRHYWWTITLLLLLLVAIDSHKEDTDRSHKLVGEGGYLFSLINAAAITKYFKFVFLLVKYIIIKHFLLYFSVISPTPTWLYSSHKKKKSLKADGRMRCSFLRLLIGPYIIASPCMNGTLDSLTLWQENRVAGRSLWMFKKQPAISGSVKTQQSHGPFFTPNTRDK